MDYRNKLMRSLIAVLKDKVSLLRAALSINLGGGAASSRRIAILRATTYSSSSPPSDRRIAAVLSVGHGSRHTASECVGTIIDRLHNTHDTFVALKCLITLHQIIARGSFILKDHLSFYPSTGGRNFLNLSRFRDGRDPETWELSSCVRWYAVVLERNLMASRALDTYISSSSSSSSSSSTSGCDAATAAITSLLNSELMKDLEVLLGIVEEICRAPDYLHHHQQNKLACEVINLVGEDYSSSQYHIFIRVAEFNDRINGLSSDESAELACFLKRLEEGREGLSVLFVNGRKRNDAFWDLVIQTKAKLVEAEKERGRERWLVKTGTRKDPSESTRFGDRVVGPSQVLRFPCESEWLRGGRLQLNVQLPRAMARSADHSDLISF